MDLRQFIMMKSLCCALMLATPLAAIGGVEATEQSPASAPLKANEPVSEQSPQAVQVDVFLAGGQSNAGREWRQAIEETLKAALREREVVVLYSCYSGAHLRSWMTDGPQGLFEADLYNAKGTGKLEQAWAALVAKGKKPRLAGFFWLQGEGDSNTLEERSVYTERFNRMCRLVAEHFEQPSLPLVLAVIDGHPDPTKKDFERMRANIEDMRKILFKLGEQKASAAFDTRGFDRTDLWHLTPAHGKAVGEGMAKLWIERFAGKNPTTSNLAVTGIKTAASPESREIALTGKLLLVPIAKDQQPPVRGKERSRLSIRVDGNLVHDVEINLAQRKENVNWWAYLEMSKYVGKTALLSMSTPNDQDGLALIESSDRERHLLPLYDESLRPQFHFSQKSGWNNDVNGLVYNDGEWHLFFQYCPVTLRHADKYWGHAVSKDLIYWEELPIALSPFTQAKGQCFSGSAVVDHHNTAGFQIGDKPPIVAVFSDFGAGVGEALAYSNDRGRTFTYYKGNPVLKHPGNDPRAIWYKYGKNDQPISAAARKLGGHWVMAVYDFKREFDKNIAFYTSTDLKSWTEQSHLPGYAECPEILELPVDPSASSDSAGTSGDRQDTRWVVFGADAQYAVGQFDGKTFTPEHEGKHRVHYGDYFASQTFSNPPDGRVIQIGWARINLPGMPFNQAFTFPHRLTLRKTPDGIRMFAAPIQEIAKLRKKTHSAGPADLAADLPAILDVSGELFEVRAEFALGQAKGVGLDIGGNRVSYDVAAGKLNGAPMTPVDGKVAMQVIVDRPMIEICGNDGAVYITSRRGKLGDVSAVKAFANGGPARLISLEVHELESIWKNWSLNAGTP